MESYLHLAPCKENILFKLVCASPTFYMTFPQNMAYLWFYQMINRIALWKFDETFFLRSYCHLEFFHQRVCTYKYSYNWNWKYKASFSKYEKMLKEGHLFLCPKNPFNFLLYLESTLNLLFCCFILSVQSDV